MTGEHSCHWPKYRGPVACRARVVSRRVEGGAPVSTNQPVHRFLEPQPRVTPAFRTTSPDDHASIEHRNRCCLVASAPDVFADATPLAVRLHAVPDVIVPKPPRQKSVLEHIESTGRHSATGHPGFHCEKIVSHMDRRTAWGPEDARSRSDSALNAESRPPGRSSLFVAHRDWGALNALLDGKRRKASVLIGCRGSRHVPQSDGIQWRPIHAGAHIATASHRSVRPFSCRCSHELGTQGWSLGALPGERFLPQTAVVTSQRRHPWAEVGP